ncbi:MAG: hypothetical protein HQL41_18665 [Alphaproteobacteria bacterium]|nr:hypothetical protein [Alphaproteobacteria bacterium]
MSYQFEAVDYPADEPEADTIRLLGAIEEITDYLPHQPPAADLASVEMVMSTLLGDLNTADGLPSPDARVTLLDIAAQALGAILELDRANARATP